MFFIILRAYERINIFQIRQIELFLNAHPMCLSETWPNFHIAHYSWEFWTYFIEAILVNGVEPVTYFFINTNEPSFYLKRTAQLVQNLVLSEEWPRL